MEELTKNDWRNIYQALTQASATVVDIDDESNYREEDVRELYEQSSEYNLLAEKIGTNGENMVKEEPPTDTENLTAKSRCFCRVCGSENVLHDAYAKWNKETQEFEVDNTFDKGGYCQDCEGDTAIDWEEIK